MGKRRQAAWIVGLVGVGLATPWALSSPHPTRLPPAIETPIERDRPAVRLEFSDTAQEPILFQSPTPAARPIVIPAELPGSEALPPKLPTVDAANPKAFNDAFEKQFPPLPPIGSSMAPELGADGRPMSLDALEQIAGASNPIIRQARASVSAADGTVQQTGLYPNPRLGFQSDAVNQNQTAGRIGGFFNVELVHLAKLRLAKAVAVADRELAGLAMSQIETEVLAGVRHGYFAVLAAQENMRLQEALTRLTDDAYRHHVEFVKANPAAAHEAVQLRVLAFQSRGQLAQARNRYISAWKQLAATVGRIEMPPTLLDGRLDRPLPLIEFEGLHACVLSKHSDLAAAQKHVEKAQLAVQLAETNRYPDISVTSAIQRDYTFGLDNMTANLQVGMPVPLFNRNQGNIAKARAELARAQEEASRVRAGLTAQLSEAFERYDSQRRLIVYYRDNIVPDQVRAFRALNERRAVFGEQLQAQQALTTAIAAYRQSLGDAWSAVVDLGKISQTRDFDGLGAASCGTEIGCLTQLPSCQAGGAPSHWPDAMPADGGTELPRLVPLPNPSVPASKPSVLDSTPSRSLLTAPLGSVERSTQRRRFFSSPGKGFGEPPQTLPQADEAPCCPTPKTPAAVSPEPPVPKMLPNLQEPPTQLPPPVKQSAAPPHPGPIIIEGPSDPARQIQRVNAEVLILNFRDEPPPPAKVPPLRLPK